MQRVRAGPQDTGFSASTAPLVLPPAGMSNHEAFLKVEAGYRMPCPSECPPTTYKLMLCCWHRDPTQRPGFKELREQLSSCTRYENP